MDSLPTGKIGCILSRQELEKKNTKNLLYIFRRARDRSLHVNLCRTEFNGSDEEWKAIMASWQPLYDYVGLLREILATREHVDREHDDA
jgi:hypothetical protein